MKNLQSPETENNNSQIDIIIKPRRVEQLGELIVVSCEDQNPESPTNLPRSTILDDVTKRITGLRPNASEWNPPPLQNMINDYSDIYRSLTGVEPMANYYECYNRISFSLGTNFFYNELYGHEWALIHACAQREAIKQVANEIGVRDDMLEPFAASLILQELELYKELVDGPDGRIWGLLDELTKRQEAQLYWHRTWIDPSYFVHLGDVLMGESILISKVAIHEFYRNPFIGVPWIGFEGLDGSGKDTQADILQQFLYEILGSKVISQGLPTKHPVGEMIRRVLEGREQLDPTALQKLFEADRAELMRSLALEYSEGISLITKRYSASGIAYSARSFDSLIMGIMGNMSLGWPDVTFFIDLPEDECLSRIKSRGKERELFEHRKVLANARKNYHTLCKILPGMIFIHGVDQDGTPRSKLAIFREIVDGLINKLSDDVLLPEQKDMIRDTVEGWCEENKELFE